MKLSRIKTILASFFVLGLIGCDNNSLPHVFSGNEVPQETLGEPRVVETPDLQVVYAQPWMPLGGVPGKPTDFTSQTLILETRQEMIDERVLADKMKDAAENPSPQPMPPGTIY